MVGWIENDRNPSKTSLQLTLFSMDFLTRVKLFQRESNSFLWVPRKNMRSLMICSQTNTGHCEIFMGQKKQTFYPPLTDTIRARHLNDDKEGLCVVFWVLQDVIWIEKDGFYCCVVTTQVRTEEVFGKSSLTKQQSHSLADGLSVVLLWIIWQGGDTQTSLMDTESTIANWAACVWKKARWLTVLDAHMQLDLPQIDHGWHPKTNNVNDAIKGALIFASRIEVLQVWYVRSIQRGQHDSSSQKAVLHNSETLQQLLPVKERWRNTGKYVLVAFFY